MAALILPSRRLVNPQQGYALDREAVRATGTIFLTFPEQELRDQISGTRLTNPGGLTVGPKGRVATFNGSQQGNAAITLPASLYSGLIVAARIRATAAQTETPGAAFGVYDSTAQGGLAVGFDPSSNAGCALLTNNGAYLRANSSVGLNTWVTIYTQIQGTSGGSAVAYINGRPASSLQGSNYSGSPATPNEISYGAQHRSTGFLRQFRGDIEWAALLYIEPPSGGWQSLTDDVALRLYESGYPYNVLAPYQRRIWVEVGGGGATNYTLTADVGAYTLTGESAGTQAGFRIGADTGAYSLTGQNATTSKGTRLVADVGAYTLTGQDATLTATATVNYTLICETGQYLLDGLAAGLEYTDGSAPTKTAGFVITDTAPRMWWQRKPKALDEEEAEQLVERVVRVVERIARTQVERPKPAPQKVRKAEVREAIAPLVEQMPGFDWMAVYRAILIELERRKQEEQARELAAAEIARIRAIEQDDEDVLLLLMSV